MRELVWLAATLLVLLAAGQIHERRNAAHQPPPHQLPFRSAEEGIYDHTATDILGGKVL